MVKYYLCVEQGESKTLECMTNHAFESCSFSHNDKKCELSFKTNRKCNFECASLKDKAEFTEDSTENGSKICSIQLKDFGKDDAGNWTCELERY